MSTAGSAAPEVGGVEAGVVGVQVERRAHRAAEGDRRSVEQAAGAEVVGVGPADELGVDLVIGVAAAGRRGGRNGSDQGEHECRAA